MPWTARSDNVDEHPKVVRLDDRAYRFWNILINYSGRALTDGLIDEEAIEHARRLMNLRRPTVDAILAQCLRIPDGFRAGLLERSGDSYLLHDYLDANPSKAQVLARRKAASERQQRRRGSKGEVSRRDGPKRHAVSHAAPLPSPPFQKEGGGGAAAPRGRRPPSRLKEPRHLCVGDSSKILAALDKKAFDLYGEDFESAVYHSSVRVLDFVDEIERADTLRDLLREVAPWVLDKWEAA